MASQFFHQTSWEKAAALTAWVGRSKVIDLSVEGSPALSRQHSECDPPEGGGHDSVAFHCSVWVPTLCPAHSRCSVHIWQMRGGWKVYMGKQEQAALSAQINA